MQWAKASKISVKNKWEIKKKVNKIFHILMKKCSTMEVLNFCNRWKAINGKLGYQPDRHEFKHRIISIEL